MKTTYLALSWSVSRGAETYGYNICRLDDTSSDKRYKCMGGGYDMTGTVFGDWLQEVYQERLKKMADRARGYWDKETLSQGNLSGGDKLCGMTAYMKSGELEKVSLDGACGIESMVRVAEAIGLEVQRTYNRKGHTTGFIVTEASA